MREPQGEDLAFALGEVVERVGLMPAGRSELPVDEPGEQDGEPDHLGTDERAHEGMGSTDRLPELVVGVAPQAVDHVADDGPRKKK